MRNFAVLLIFCLIVLPAPAQAGFEWLPSAQDVQPAPPPPRPVQEVIPPPAPQQAAAPLTQMPAAPQPAPAQPMPAQPQTPVWGTLSNTAPAQAPTHMQVLVPQQQYAAPVAPPPAQPAQQAQPQQMHQMMQMQQQVQTPYAQPPAAMPVSAPVSAPVQIPAPVYPLAVGFGSDMPLAFALQQIVPEGYSQSFGKDVNLGARVSWSGGKPWNEVIMDMITPLGLELKIEDSKVFIHRRGAYSAAPQAAVMIQPPASAAPAMIAPQAQNTMPAHTSAQAVNLASLAPPVTPQPAQQQQPVASAPPVQQSAPAAATLAPTAQQARFWQGYEGQNIRDILIEWAPQANVNLIWQATENYTLANNVLINDTFNNALIKVFNENLEGGRMPLVSFVDAQGDGRAGTLIVKDRNG